MTARLVVFDAITGRPLRGRPSNGLARATMREMSVKACRANDGGWKLYSYGAAHARFRHVTVRLLSEEDAAELFRRGGRKRSPKDGAVF